MESSAQQRYCDIVMKGGIASGVVYPLAAVELAEEHGYEFRNVGGTSAGAIAAAAVAAAEHGRRSRKNEDSYKRIAELPDELGASLTSLFQPWPRMRPLFRTLLASLRGGAAGKLVAPLRGFRLEALLGALPGIALIAMALLLDGDAALRIVTGAVGLLALLVVPYLAVAASAVVRLRGLPDLYFGICPGNDRNADATPPPLTRWLTDLINELAGMPDDRQLTFKDLWDLRAPLGERGVNLQMMTTNLSQGRPYSLPFEGGEELWFSADELRDLFPAEVVEQMTGDRLPSAVSEDGKDLHPFPAAADLPVVVAARMSLSFPGLIAAVPLYAMNDAPERPSGKPERCWFSDGGITSNLPVHFFDSPVPRWPTFAIDLIPLTPNRRIDAEDQCRNVWLPERNEQGIAEAWVGWEADSGLAQLGKFAASIFRTAQNWIDNRQLRGAGYRDRIAHVRLSPQEGGMNLTMDPCTIKRLAERGECAADALARRFGPNPPEGTELTWANQKWVRYRSHMELLERKGREARRGFLDESLGVSLRAMRGAPPSYPPPQGEGELPDPALDEAVAEFGAWEGEERRFAGNAPPPPTEPWSIPRV